MKYLLPFLLSTSFAYATPDKLKQDQFQSQVQDLHNNVQLQNAYFNRVPQNLDCNTQLGKVSVGSVSHSIATLSGCIGYQDATDNGTASFTLSFPLVPKSVLNARKHEERKLTQSEADRQLIEALLRRVDDMTKKLNRQGNKMDKLEEEVSEK